MIRDMVKNNDMRGMMVSIAQDVMLGDTERWNVAPRSSSTAIACPHTAGGVN